MKKTKKLLVSTAIIATIPPIALSSTGVILESQRALAEDIIIHSFSGKLYGMRKSVKKKIDQEFETEENTN